MEIKSVQEFNEITKFTHCRFCAQEKNIEELLFLTGNQESAQYLKLIETFKIDFINFYDTKLPKTLCDNCCDEFQSCYLFFTKVKESQVILNKLYHNDIKEEPTDSFYLKTEHSSDDEQKTELNEIKLEETLPHLFKTTNNTTCENSSIKVTPKNTLITVTDNKDANGQEDSDTAPVEAIYLSASDKNNHSRIKTSEENIFKKPIIKKLPNYDDDNISIDSGVKALESQSGPSNINHRLNLSDQSCDKEGTSSTESSSDDDDSISLSSDDSNTSILPCESINKSWSDYPWSCIHCGTDFNSMEEVRCHSKELHGRCYGFSCKDCDVQFNTFNTFIEHVRQHQKVLRYYCQYCNEKFDHPDLCVEHALTHWSDEQKICDRCGEICPDANSLDNHKKLYKETYIPLKFRKKRPKVLLRGTIMYNGIPVNQFGSWSEYEWTCEDCWVRYPDVDSLRSHTREFHNKCFSMKCVDCLKVLANYPAFVTHVTAHRPYLKEYCQYCNQSCGDADELTKHVKSHLEGDHKPCDGCGQIFDSKTQLLQHLKQFNPKRTKGRVTKEELTCNICLKTFKILSMLQSHLKSHETNRKRNHICDICGKSFLHANYLAYHVEVHNKSTKQEICLICKKTFTTKIRLKAHVLTHTDIKVYTCDICGKQFKIKHSLRSHIIRHYSVNQFQCTFCSKSLKTKVNLNNHIKIHSGMRPYACKCCDKTFTNWSNCNKHMIRIHGITLAKTKITPRGRADINEKTGKVKKMQFDKNAKDWLEQMLNRETGKKPAK